MPTVLIRLDPSRMANPDADLRYVVPDRLVEASQGVLADGAYDYETGSDAMLIFLSADNVDAALPFVIDLLENHVVYDNRLADSAKVGTSDADDSESPSDFITVYPISDAGERMG